MPQTALIVASLKWAVVEKGKNRSGKRSRESMTAGG